MTLLAALVRSQRRGLSRSLLAGLSGRAAQAALRSAVLLRLAILLCRSHAAELPLLQIRAREAEIGITLPRAWPDAHALRAPTSPPSAKTLPKWGLSCPSRPPDSRRPATPRRPQSPISF